MVAARIQIICQGCNEQFLVLSSEQGHVAECPNCNGWVDVPELGPSAEMRELEAFTKLNDQSLRLQEESAKLNSRFGQLLDRFESTIDQWAKVAEKMDRMMERFNSKQS